MKLRLFRRDVVVYVEIPDMPFSSRRVPRLALKEAIREHGQWIVFVDQRRRYRKRGTEKWLIGQGPTLWDTLKIYPQPDDVPF